MKKEERCDICLKDYPKKFIHMLAYKGEYAFINACPECARDLIITLNDACPRHFRFKDERKNEAYDEFVGWKESESEKAL